MLSRMFFSWKGGMIVSFEGVKGECEEWGWYSYTSIDWGTLLERRDGHVYIGDFCFVCIHLAIDHVRQDAPVMGYRTGRCRGIVVAHRYLQQW